MKGFFSFLSAVLALLSLCSCWTWRSSIYREYEVCDVQNRPVEGAQLFLLRRAYANMVPMFPWYYRILVEDAKEAHALRLQSDSAGRLVVRVRLHYPSAHDALFLAKGYYPTLVSLTSREKKIILLDEASYTPRKGPGESWWDILLSIPEMYADYFRTPKVWWDKRVCLGRADAPDQLLPATQGRNMTSSRVSYISSDPDDKFFNELWKAFPKREVDPAMEDKRAFGPRAFGPVSNGKYESPVFLPEKLSRKEREKLISTGKRETP